MPLIRFAAAIWPRIAQMRPCWLRYQNMDVLREYEIRLFDSDRKLVLVVPIIAASDELAQEQAATLSRREKATDFAIRPQMRSANYRNTNRDAAR